MGVIDVVVFLVEVDIGVGTDTGLGVGADVLMGSPGVTMSAITLFNGVMVFGGAGVGAPTGAFRLNDGADVFLVDVDDVVLVGVVVVGSGSFFLVPLA